MAAVLLLNASYEPLAVIPRRRALSLLQRDRVQAAADDHLQIPTASRIVQIPTVLRLKRYAKVPKRGARWSRGGVLRRDRFTCIYCGIRVGDLYKGKKLQRQQLTIDHIVPRCRGGRNSWTNTACACPTCNQRKGDRSPHQAGMTLRWEPKTPRVDYLVASGSIPDAWKFYLEV